MNRRQRNRQSRGLNCILHVLRARYGETRGIYKARLELLISARERGLNERLVYV